MAVKAFLSLSPTDFIAEGTVYRRTVPSDCIRKNASKMYRPPEAQLPFCGMESPRTHQS